MTELIQSIMDTVDKKKVQSLCKKVLKKCSFKSANDLNNVLGLANAKDVLEFYSRATGGICGKF